MRDDELTPDEIAELGALLVAERPRPSEEFTAELDARVTERFARPARARAGARRRWLDALRRPLLVPAAATVAVTLVALVVALGDGGGTRDEAGSASERQTFAPEDSAARVPAPPSSAAGDGARTFRLESAAPTATTGLGGGTGTRKVERSARLELGAEADRVDDVAQDVLGVVARFDGIVDRSNVSSGQAGGGADFLLRIPSPRLQEALAALSRLPDARVLARSDEAVDVNQAYTSVRRQLAAARAERSGLLRALAAAGTEDETLRLRARLDAVERTIARAESAQRGLDRRVDWARVAVTVRTDGAAIADDEDGLTLGGAFDDAARVLEVAAAVALIAAAALVPLLVLGALAWPLARALRRRRREQALNAA